MVGCDSLRTGCGACADCRSVADGTHPDLHLVYRQLNREHPDADVRKRKALDIGVDVLRHFVIDKVGLTPHRSRAKVFIIREADRITTQAQNALLKTLEEPPGTTFLLLLVESLDRLLPTTLSRCQVVRFDALPTHFVRETLAALRPESPPAALDWYARVSAGSIGNALEWIDDQWYDLNARFIPALAELLQSVEKNADPTAFLKLIAEESDALGERFRKRDPDITDTEAKRRGFQTLFFLAATLLSDVLRTGAENAPQPVNAELRSVLTRLRTRLPDSRAIQCVRRLALAERHLDLNANVQLVVETMINDLLRLAAGSKRIAMSVA
jgi:DNA polymerase III gamma/tau subunit